MVGLQVISVFFFFFIFINYSTRGMCYLHNIFLGIFFIILEMSFEIPKIILQHSDIYKLINSQLTKEHFHLCHLGLDCWFQGKRDLQVCCWQG